MTEIETAVRAAIVESLGVEPETIKLESTLADDLGADSLDQVELVMAIEEHFGIEIEDDAMENIKTVADIIAVVEKLKA